MEIKKILNGYAKKAECALENICPKAKVATGCL